MTGQLIVAMGEPGLPYELHPPVIGAQRVLPPLPHTFGGSSEGLRLYRCDRTDGPPSTASVRLFRIGRVGWVHFATAAVQSGRGRPGPPRERWLRVWYDLKFCGQ
ncbi:unnamed protein product [Prorocentrum cordatum]|uniref:Anaphase-promoting complex subunit 1 n=1 Tax=Prorocentrum cordatum TaxID=2364126 RepID=A0ABN9YEJ4_9DINO|nr:unnamed protein product [Polarella glacialis]